jgi:hypothetical protein
VAVQHAINHTAMFGGASELEIPPRRAPWHRQLNSQGVFAGLKLTAYCGRLVSKVAMARAPKPVAAVAVVIAR